MSREQGSKVGGIVNALGEVVDADSAEGRAEVAVADAFGRQVKEAEPRGRVNPFGRAVEVEASGDPVEEARQEYLEAAIEHDRRHVTASEEQRRRIAEARARGAVSAIQERGLREGWTAEQVAAEVRDQTALLGPHTGPGGRRGA